LRSRPEYLISPQRVVWPLKDKQRLRSLKTRFQRFDALKSCAKIVMAMAILAGGLLLIRLFGEERLQRFLDMVFLEKKYSKNTMEPENHSAFIVSINSTSQR
jgi:hypothetical protein